MSPENEIWQVEVNGQIYQTNFNELTQWIQEGAVLREDKVKRGNLRWLEAGRIPKLVNFFNTKDLHFQPEMVATTNAPLSEESAQTQTENIGFQQHFAAFENQTENPQPENQTVSNQIVNPNACAVHEDAEPFFVCETCTSIFCTACPKTYGSVKCCPLCGALCRPIQQINAENERNFEFQNDLAAGFGFSDFGNALAYPFKFKTSLIAGGIMFAFFTLGQAASAIGGIIMFAAALFCMALSNMLTFGVLANTVENFSQGKIGTDFMPGFDDFELWNDVIQPFFLSIGVYIVSFGLLIVMVVGGVWYIAGSISNSMQEQTVSMMPDVKRDLQSAKDLPKIRQTADDIHKKTQFADGEIPSEKEIAESQTFVNDEEREMQEIQSLIDEHRKGQLESVAGKSDETVQAEYSAMFGNLFKTAFPVVILIFPAMLWGLFYFPAACLVAGYTRSFTATINPLIGLDTIKRLGFDYVKILLMGVVLLLFSGILSVVISAILSPFNMPRMGNLPAIFISGFVTFYISIVFSVILGFAMYKNSDKFNLFRVKKMSN